MLKLINHPNYRRHEAAIDQLGLMAERKDAAGDTLFLARELEQVSASTYDVLKDPIMGRRLVPFVNELAEGAETWSYDMYDGLAKAEWITNYATPVGQADAFKVRVTVKARSFGSSYHYTIDDLAAAGFAGGRGLDRERARFARIAHEQFLDDLVAVGDATRSISGLTTVLTDLGFTEQTFQTANAPFIAPIVGTWDSSTTSLEKIKDLEALCMTPELNTKGNFKADRLILPLSVKPLMQATFDVADARTVQAVFLANQPADGIKSIDYWSRLNTASALTGPRAIAYKASPDVLKFVQAYDFREMPPEVHNYSYQVATYARVIGLTTVYPLAIAQMDLDS